MEAGLKSEAVHDVELSPEHDSGRFLLGTLDAELAGKEAELIRFLTKQLGYDPHAEVPVMVEWVVRAVDEDVLFP